MSEDIRTPADEARANLHCGHAPQNHAQVPAVSPITDVRAFGLATTPAAAPHVPVVRWYASLGEFLDAYDAEARYAIVVDGERGNLVAHDVRLGSESNDADRPQMNEPPVTTMDGRLDFLTDEGAEEGVDLIDVRAIGLVEEVRGED